MIIRICLINIENNCYGQMRRQQFTIYDKCKIRLFYATNQYINIY